MIRMLKYASKDFFQIVNYCKETSSQFYILYTTGLKKLLYVTVCLFCDEKF